MSSAKPPTVQRGNQKLGFGESPHLHRVARLRRLPAWPLPAQSSRAVLLATHRAPAGSSTAAWGVGGEGQGVNLGRRPVEVELKETGHRATARVVGHAIFLEPITYVPL